MSGTILDGEDGYETESDPTPTQDEAPAAGATKRKRRVSMGKIFVSTPGSHAEIIVLQGYDFGFEGKQKAEGIVHPTAFPG